MRTKAQAQQLIINAGKLNNLQKAFKYFIRHSDVDYYKYTTLSIQTYNKMHDIDLFKGVQVVYNIACVDVHFLLTRFIYRVRIHYQPAIR